MSFFQFVNTLLIGPLKLIFDVIFSFALRVNQTPGFAIIALSLVVNFLVLPLYQRADEIQDDERIIQEKMRPWNDHIKATFSGDERFLIQQAYYRQNNYSPFSSLRALLPLLLEIPFFMAAYQFLSELQLLSGSSFGFIRDLSKPDALFIIGPLVINVLPIMMTIINLISSEIYMKGAPFKAKLQLYAMAFIFLVLLYNSPAGLTFYWMLNNLFSLGKNILHHFRKSQPVLKNNSHKSLFSSTFFNQKPNTSTFFLCQLFISILTGLLIPATVLHSSPGEFVDRDTLLHPLWYLSSSFALSTGTFIIWLGVYYSLAKPRIKKLFEVISWASCGICLINYMCFGTEMGLLSSTLQYGALDFFTLNENLINIALACAITFVFFVLLKKKIIVVKRICIIGCTALLCMTGIYAKDIHTLSLESIQAYQQTSTETLSIPLSKNGKNVVVIMMDRAFSCYIPCIFYEKPELKEIYDGFVYYPNTISFGVATNFGMPGVFGGYDYTPEEMNNRPEQSLKDKHNEALLTMPILFGQNDFKVTVVDPSYAGDYRSTINLSIYDNIPNTKAYVTPDEVDFESSGWKISQRNRNFFCFALMKVSPTFLQKLIYNYGKYNQSSMTISTPPKTLPTRSEEITMQSIGGLSKATGVNLLFMTEYVVLDKLDEVTEITDDTQNTLLLMTSNLTHEPALLGEPEYLPYTVIDNTEYDATHMDRFQAGDIPLIMDNVPQMEHYHIDMAAMIKFGEWLEFLKKNGLYDNTRIILVSDHARKLYLNPDLIMNYGDTETDILSINPLLMVKDFDASGELKTDYTFMTNADVPTIATNQLIDHPVNPFTGNKIDSSYKLEHEIHITTSTIVNVDNNRGNKFKPALFLSVHDNIFDLENWSVWKEY